MQSRCLPGTDRRPHRPALESSAALPIYESNEPSQTGPPASVPDDEIRLAIRGDRLVVTGEKRVSGPKPELATRSM